MLNYPGLNNDIEIKRKAIISYHFNLFMNQPCVAAVKINIADKEVITTINPCQKLSIPIKSNSVLNMNTIGKIPVLKLYQNA